MEQMPPSQFYTGIVAQAYGPLRGTGAPDPAPYAKFIARSGEPALELGCGEGEPLLDLRALGLDIEGLDSSPDMVERCRAAARARGLDVVVHLQAIEAMSIPRQFRSIFLAGPTFDLLADDDVALAALECIRDHLASDGAVLIPLFTPDPTPAEHLRRPRRHVEPDGIELVLTPVSETRDEARRTQTTVLRYERTGPDGTTVVERPWVLHWYGQDDLRRLVAAAGLEVASLRGPAGGAATPDDTSFAAVLRHPRPVG
jgi:SAM-dependent methyltransferase